jgi:hypothetical protein
MTLMHAHVVAGSPAGDIVEWFTDPERDSLQVELFEDRSPQIRSWPSCVGGLITQASAGS